MFGSMFDVPSVSRSQKALFRLASIDPVDLCKEAKGERCRATRDLRSCGRDVRRVLIPCGHAALCEECSQRCDVCPICRIALPKGGNDLPLRLYYECIVEGLISERCDDRLCDEEDGENQLTADVQRLYSLFDVALDNNLVSLICHYVCMDESAVSSDPVTALLLDEKVVKGWCRQTFRNLLTELQAIYNLSVLEMKSKLTPLQKISSNLAAMSNVIEVLESSFRSSTSAMVQDLNHFQESLSKTKQHLEVMIWCIRHEFLENVRSRYSDFESWSSCVRERKSEAIKRAWPDSVNCSEQSTSSLFVEDALSNLDTEQGYTEKDEGELEIASLLAAGSNSFFRSNLHGMAACYPFQNSRAAVDLLFLQGNSDLVVAKQAIFLYYLFDRHHKVPIGEWRPIVDDFAVTFNITRHSLLESLVFYLLDDHTDEALKEASRLLPEIAGPNFHPKVAQALLERQNPDAALMVLRWSGRDGGATLVSLGEAVTAVRVRVECGLLTEAFMYQRMICTKVKDKKLLGSYDDVKEQCCNWLLWLEVLVTEICCLCIRRNLIDRMIGLPWNSDEEKHLHKCLFDFVTDDPSSTLGSVLVVFYLQRYRYIEAYQVDSKLQTLEEDFISKIQNDGMIYKMLYKYQTQSVDLLPDILKQQLKTGILPEICGFPANENISAQQSDLPKLQEPVFGNLLFKAPQLQWESNGFLNPQP
ncbi:E3 ubiquitin-protein ligase hos1 [Phtheirospermum japonicum]|uniref:E3 ubiquitin-protein ligase hos1 n=1 Tax=Phtheirospermum japonicum TaxID=374723 RepID=A0A830C4X6_9LAMI|nr:E3 ubiquitin-protein ligase hos1 [Phtheirospermum japonicum]